MIVGDICRVTSGDYNGQRIAIRGFTRDGRLGAVEIAFVDGPAAGLRTSIPFRELLDRVVVEKIVPVEGPGDGLVVELLDAWHEMTKSKRSEIQAGTKRAVDRRKFVALDYEVARENWSGAMLVDKATRVVFEIKAYGRPNYKKRLGMIEDLAAKFRAQAEINRHNARLVDATSAKIRDAAGSFPRIAQ
jgi:hypothetical protein